MISGNPHENLQVKSYREPVEATQLLSKYLADFYNEHYHKYMVTFHNIETKRGGI